MRLAFGGAMVTITEYNNLSAVVRIRKLWRSLWWKTPRASFFQSFEWFERHCRQSADLQEPRVFVVAVDGRPVGLAPWVEKRVDGRFLRRRLLTNLLSPQGFCYGPLGAQPKLTLDAALAHARAAGRWQLDIEDVERRGTSRPVQTGDFDAPQESAAADESRALVECHGDWVRYVRSLPTDVVEQYRRSECTLDERGTLEYIRYRPEGTTCGDDDPRWELFGTIERTQPGSRNNAERRRSLQAMHETATAIAGVDLNVLALNGQAIAWAYNYRCDGRLEMQRLHARLDYATAASSVLLGRMLQDGFRRGDESYLFDRQTTRQFGDWQTLRAKSRRLAS